MCWSSYDRRDRHRDRGYRVADRVPSEPASTPAAAAPPPRDPDLRVSQAERDAVVSLLAGHYADGRLSLGEYEDRVAAALAATTGRDLDALFTDLPGGAPAPPAPAVPPAASSRPAGPGLGASRPAGVPPFARRQGPGFSGLRVPAVLAIVALSFLAGPWALFLLWPVLAMTSGACGRNRSHHARHRANDWDRLDDREPVRML
jgi:hypothetical protein